MHPQTVPAGNSPEYHSQFRVATELGDVHGSGKLKINQVQPGRMKNEPRRTLLLMTKNPLQQPVYLQLQVIMCQVISKVTLSEAQGMVVEEATIKTLAMVEAPMSTRSSVSKKNQG
jgi:hypothetical protein